MTSKPAPPMMNYAEDFAADAPPPGIDHLLALHAQEILTETLILTDTQAEYVEALIDENPEIAARLDMFMDALAVAELSDELAVFGIPHEALVASETHAPITDSALYKIRLARGCLNDTTLVTPRKRSVADFAYNFGLTEQE